jgi:Protein of unknown function (DUF2892)
MAAVCNLGRPDRIFRIVLGIGMGIAGILVNGHPYLGRLLGIAGAIVILSAVRGT